MASRAPANVTRVAISLVVALGCMVVVFALTTSAELHHERTYERTLPAADVAGGGKDLLGSSRGHRSRGYKPVLFYVGSQQLERTPQAKSQSGQDMLVARILNGTLHRRGFFVDLAANDARVFSNTFRLETEWGWRGVCVEANPAYLWDLARRRCQLVAAAVSDSPDASVGMTLQAGIGRISTLEDGPTLLPSASYADVPPAHSAQFRTATLESILRVTRAPRLVDYLSLDIEGAEYLALRRFPFDAYRFTLLTVERPPAPLRQLLAARGYRFVLCLTDYGETLYAHESARLDARLHRNLVTAIAAWPVAARESCWFNRLHPVAPPAEQRWPGIPYPPARADDLGGADRSEPQWVVYDDGRFIAPN